MKLNLLGRERNVLYESISSANLEDANADVQRAYQCFISLAYIDEVAINQYAKLEPLHSHQLKRFQNSLRANQTLFNESLNYICSESDMEYVNLARLYFLWYKSQIFPFRVGVKLNYLIQGYNYESVNYKLCLLNLIYSFQL